MMMLAITMVMPASTWAQVMYTVYEYDTLTFKYGDRQSEESGDVYDVPTDPKDPDWLAINTSITTVVFDESFKDARPTSCYKWFYNCSNLTSINNIENLNTEEVTNMSYMFDNCSSLTSLDVSKFNTAKVTNMSFMFRGCSGLTSLDVSKFNTAEVTHMGDMFRWCSGLTSLDLSSFNTAKVENMSVMFGGCWKLTTIYVSDDFTIGKVSGSDNMFEGCNQLKGAVSYNSGKTGIDMANFDGYFTPKNITPYVKWDANAKVLTFKVANTKEEGSGVYDLNEGANALEWVGEVCSDCEKVVFTPSFKQARPTSCRQWFLGFSQLTTIEGIENLNTEKVTDMSEMFNSCSGLKNLDLSSFNTAKVENMSYMFGGCYDLISLDLSSFNTAKVTDMTWMFYNCQSLTTIYASDGFTTVEVSSSDGMFESCFVLEGATPWDITKTGIDMANFDGYFTPKTITPYVKWDGVNKVLTFKVANNKEEGAYDLNESATAPGWSIDEVKNYCTKVVFTSSFNHAKPTSCYLWFEGFEQLTTIEGIENLNTEEVTNMSGMFGGCSGLTSLDVSKFNTAEVENMSFMFYICSSLTSLDVSKFNTAKVTDMGNMFGGCSGLTSLDLSSFNTAKVENMAHMFDICSDLTSLDLSSFNTAKVTGMSEMFINCLRLKTIYVSDDFKIGDDTNGDNMFYNCNNLKGDVSYDPANTDKSMANYKTGYFTKSNLTPYVKWDANTKVLTFKVANTKEEGVYDLNQGANDLGWSIDDVKNNCTKVVFTSSFIHAKPTSCYKWFDSFSNLTKIEGIENLNTEKVTDMMYMFCACKKLSSLDLSKFNTANVTNMRFMFQDCSGLISLNLSSFNTANVTNMSHMFYNCSGLKSLNLSNFNTAKVENMSYMFSGCSGLENLDLSSFNTANVTTMSNMFNYCKKLTSLNLSNFNTDNVTDMIYMFNNCSSITSLDLSSFNTAKVKNMRYMFDGCQKLTSLKLSNFNTANVTNMSYMFNNCRELTSLDLSDFDTANVTNMSYMFSDCKKFTSLDLSNFDTSNVTDMFQMFYECSGLTSLDLSSFNTAEVENMSYMFNGCSGLTSLNLSSFNTAEVKNMSYMFFGCSGLTTLDVSKFNTAKVENMSYMFYDCSGLKNLDLSSFNTAEVTDMSGMFNYSENLTTIYVSDGFDTRKASSSSMFESCFALVGAAQYSPSNTDQSMANYTTGYFKTYFTLGDSKVELCGNPLTTESLNLSDNYDFTPKYDFKAVSATYSRDLSSSNSTWFSLCLPFAYTPGNNFTAYQLKGATANAVEIEEITGEIAAGTPVLFKFKGGVVDVNKKINISETKAEIVKAPVNGAKVNGTDGSSLQLCGTYQTKTFSKDADGNAFILLNDKLMNPARMLTTPGVTSVSVKPFRAYMTLTASAESSAQTSSARAFSIGHGGEGNEGTTAIDLLNSVATDDAEYYDINGRRIDAPAKGVNIVRRGNKTIKLIIK